MLRAINVTGYNRVAMADLRALFDELGLGACETLLQSGNVVFDGGKRKAGDLERALEAAATERLGITTDFVVRTAREWTQLVAANPFGDEAERDPGHLLVTCLKQAPAASALETLRAAIVGRERVHLDGKQLYTVYPDGVGRSKLTNALVEKKLATRGTARNWNTVLKLAAKL